MYMERDKALSVFLSEQMEAGIAAIEGAETYSRTNRESFRLKLEEVFRKLAVEIRKRQQSGRKGNIFCIYLCFFRSDFYVRKGKIRVYAYDKRFFLDPEPLWEEMEFVDVDSFLWRLEDGLLSSLNKYRNKIAGSDVRMLIQTQYVPYLVADMTELARYAVRKGCADCFADLSVTDNFCIMSGEYQGTFEEVFLTRGLDTGGVALKDYLRIHKEEEDAFCSRLYREESLQNLDLKGIQLTKSRFERVDLSGTDLSGGKLMQTEWRQCRMKGVCLKETKLFGAVFDETDLSDSDFRGCIGPILPSIISGQLALGINEVNFSCSNLAGVQFAGANLKGADFRGAYFKGTDFTDAQLYGAVFDKDAWMEAELTQ